MEFDYSTKKPLVRIGTLQSENKMRFTGHVPFDFIDLSGKMIASGEVGKTYEVMVEQSQPAVIKPVIRLAISYDQHEAQNLVQQWEKLDLQIQLIRVGENSQIDEDRYIDNREYWILAIGFSSIEEAEEQRRRLPDFGSYLVFLIQEKPATGSLRFEEHEIPNGIRMVPKQHSEKTFTLENVRVGIGFHWDHRESQNYENILEFQIDKKGLITAINVLDIENYLASVNSSEMVAECNLDFLKAQTIVARNTVFATAGKHHYGDAFDLCADDHCQCFHGSGAIQPKSMQAANETAGQVLIYENRVCDTRYAKVCGGIGETYQNVWDDRHLPYLDKFYDGMNDLNHIETADREESAKAFINANPDVFCNPEKHHIPQYLQYAHQYFRWKVNYKPEELGKIVANKLARDIGPVRDIVPLKRGYSGRLIYAKLVGDRGEMKIGKELEIRRALSESHLYSSCFYVEKESDNQGNTTQIIVHGAGWGHGVGLCQVGAAIMGEEGFEAEQILKHYYHAATLKRIY